MRFLLHLSTLFFFTLALTGCGADGNLDAGLVQEYAERFQQEILPTKAEFKRMAEAQIAMMPAAEQAEARKSLEEILADWPTDEEITNAITDAANDLPTRAEINESLKEMDEAPGGSMISNMIRGALNEAPAAGEVNDLIEQGLDEMENDVKKLRAKAND